MWPWGSGKLSLPRDNGVFFMPQRPCLPIRTLAGAVVHPAAPDGADHAELAGRLRDVGLDHLAARLEEIGNWGVALTLSEQQRIGFARLLVHKPRSILLQEATSSLDETGEASMMRLPTGRLAPRRVLTADFHPSLEAWAAARGDRRRGRPAQTQCGLTMLEKTPSRRDSPWNSAAATCSRIVAKNTSPSQ